MSYGLYLSAGGLLTNSYRQDVLSNNLANVNTVGFKPDLPTLQARGPESAQRNAPLATSQQLLDRLGGGVQAGPQRIAFSVGVAQPTGRALDAALTVNNQFFAVSVNDPATGQPVTRLTRDGRFNVDRNGRLTTITGHTVLGPGDQPIVVTPGVPVTLGDDGRVLQNDAEVGRIQISEVSDLGGLEKAGANLFGFRKDDMRVPANQPHMKVGALEGSATNAMGTMMGIIKATKAANSSARLIDYYDDMMERAINTLGRVA